MKLRLMATAYLRHNGNFLMMKRAETRELAPGLWAGLGGHLEPAEMSSPEAACRREIFEESGLAEKDLRDFRLQCVVLRLFGTEELRQQFIYFGETNTETVRDSQEGALHWIPESEVMRLAMPKITRIILGRFLAGRFDPQRLYLGVSQIGRGDAAIEWTAIEDFNREPPPLMA
jgi:8-oxo-dGTP diphosphatase